MTNKIYMENSYLRELEAEVLEKKYTNNKYYIKLNRTIFYPNLSGGQPGDKGTLNGVEILEAYEDGNDIVHVLNNNITGNKAIISIDWDNRLDLMQQHSGQHLLSSVFYKLYNGETVGFNISKEYVYIDITIPNLSEEEAEKVDYLANRIIYSNFNIKSYFASEEEIEKLPLRKLPTVSSNIRIVEIDGIDFSPCGGTHLNNTGEIGIIKIRKWERRKGLIRVEFVCGNRALHDYTWKNQYIKELGLLLTSKDKDILENIKKLYSSKDLLEKENRELRENLYRIKGDTILEGMETIGDIKFIYKELDNMDFKELGFIANYLSLNSSLIQIYGLKNEEKGQLYISRTKDIDINLQEIYREVASKFKIKGGGNSNTVQGGCDLKDLKPIMDLFLENIKKQNKG